MKYKSCYLLEHGIIFTWQNVLSCCSYNANDNGNVLFNKYFSDKEFSIEKILEKKRELRQNFKEGRILKGCINCYNLQEKDWDDEDYINYVYVSHWTKCNCNCFYCYYDSVKDKFQKFKNKKLLPVLQKMQKNNLLKNNVSFIITGGEPTELNELDSIIDFCLKYNISYISVNSSCIKYNKSVAKALSKDILELTLSLDCSDSIMYKKIKRIDAFDTVIKNLKKYIQAQGSAKTNVRVKYIILPGINDSIEEMEKWLLLCYKLNVKRIVLDVQTQYYTANKNNISQNIKNLIKYFKVRAGELQIETVYYSHAAQIIYEENNTRETL